ncbi:Ger(x)C family spore germination protein [Paenibacillus sp. CF384]|uniref:Ger(x)C family spore germination protein n=1 Tax=Paenibacillus sp. CF384 TaxID=1884382 RepID=UPI00089C4102|nr:Ger(x)C family spore germination protein [Paenibacillus sp. CF384]SDX82136.1 germination protein, Ger(x)C family [Paenibacillus sp. CF384]
MNRSVKRALGLAISAGMVLLLCGCWDNRDINHRSLPIGMGLALHKGIYEVVLQIPEPARSGVNIRILKQKGETISQAVDKISERMESSVDLLHLKFILIEKGYAEQGLKDSISSFMRSKDISPKVIISICDDKIGPFFDYVQRSMNPTSTTLYDCFEKNAGWNPQMALTRIWEVYRSIYSYTRDVAVPIIKTGRSGTIDYVGSAIMRNGKMVDQITPDESLLFNAFNGESAQGKIEVTDKASVLILGSSMNHRSSFSNNTPYLDIQMTIKVSVVETRGTVTSQIIKQELNAALTKRFNHLFHKMQTREADILGIGQYFRTKIPRSHLSHWRSEYLPRLQLHFRVNTIIQNEGKTKLA